MATKPKNNKKISASKNRAVALRAILVCSLCINLGVLIMIPSHFSVVVLVLIASSIVGLRKITKQGSRFALGAVAALVLSILFATLMFRWTQVTDSRCAGLFGINGSCFGGMQHIMLEFYAVPVILALVTLPLLSAQKTK